MKADAIVAIQANSPTIQIGLMELARIIMEYGCPELMTCHDNYRLYGSIWALTKKVLKNYGDPHRPKPNVLLVDPSIDIHNRLDFIAALEQFKRK